MFLTDLEQDTYRRCGFATATPDTATQTRIRAFLNETQQEILSEPGMDVLLGDSLTFASVASTPEYTLPATVGDIRQIRDTSNRITLTPRSLGWYRGAYPDPTAVTGTSDSWVEMGYVAQTAAPTGTLEVISSSASDGATKTVFIEGYTTTGTKLHAVATSVTLNGITAVSVGTTSWTRITKFFVALTAGGSTTATGTITLRHSTAGSTVSTIEAGDVQARFKNIALAICPSAVLTYTVDFQRDVTDMAQATDQPVIPARFHRLLAVGARMKEYEKQLDTNRYVMAQREFEMGKRKLKFYVYNQAAGILNLRGGETQKPSQLGAWFPAGS